MSAFVIFIILAIVVYFISYNKGNNEDIKKIYSQGGIDNKFYTLINYFYSIDRNMRILSKSDKYMTVGAIMNGTDMMEFSLHYNFSRVTIIWRFDTPIFGAISEKFEFPDYYSQEMMIDEINLKIGNVLVQYIQILKNNT